MIDIILGIKMRSKALGILALLSVVIVLAFSSISFAGTVTNATTGTPYSDLQSALNAASSGDTLWCEGLFNAHDITWPNTNNITLMLSPDATSPATVDAQSQGRLINMTTTVNLTIEGVTMKNGSTGADGASCMFVQGGSNILLNNVIVEDCSTEGEGAFADWGATVEAHNSIFRRSIAGEGGGVAVGGYFNGYDSQFVQNLNNNGQGGVIAYTTASNFYNCSFISNEAVSNGGVFINGTIYTSGCVFADNKSDGQGGVAASLTEWNAQNCTFSGNRAHGYGGVAYANNSGLGSYFLDCTFEGNVAGNDGGDFYNVYPLVATGCAFSGDSTSANGGVISGHCIASFYDCVVKDSVALNGGVVDGSNGDTLNALNCIFSNNTATNDGGVFYSTNNGVTLMNCTLYGNKAANGGVARNGNLSAVNSIMWGNSSMFYYTSASVQYSDAQPAGYSPLGFVAGTGNISVEPRFISTDESNANFLQLDPGSPCIDSGTSSGAPSYDLADNIRPFGLGYDMGVYEFQGPSVSVEYPNGGEVVHVNDVVPINWVISAESVTGNANIMLSTNEGASWNSLGIQSLVVLGPNTFPWTPTVDEISTECLISVEARDGNGFGNWDVSNAVFTISSEVILSLGVCIAVWKRS